MKTDYSDIVFLQGDEAEEVISVLDDKGEYAAFNYLMQWYTGEEPPYEMPEGSTPWGQKDRLYRHNDFMMNYNRGIPYIGLVEIFELTPMEELTVGRADQ